MKKSLEGVSAILLGMVIGLTIVGSYLGYISFIWMTDINQPCTCTVKIGNQTLTVEDAFEYVTKGLSDHQWLEVQQAINQSCED